LPDDLSFEHAAAGNCMLGCTYTAAQHVEVKAGDVVIVAGIGFIGLGAVANALYRGATVIALGRNEYRMDLCRSVGAQYVINPDDPDWLRQIHDLTGGRQGVDVAFECSGAPYYLDRCFEGLRRYGAIYSLGFLGSGDYTVSILNMMMDRHISWTGGHDVRFRDRDGLLRMLGDVEVQRQIDVMNTHSFPMSQAQEAFEVGLSKQCGKIYLRPGE